MIPHIFLIYNRDRNRNNSKKAQGGGRVLRHAQSTPPAAGNRDIDLAALQSNGVCGPRGIRQVSFHILLDKKEKPANPSKLPGFTTFPLKNYVPPSAAPLSGKFPNT